LEPFQSKYFIAKLKKGIVFGYESRKKSLRVRRLFCRNVFSFLDRRRQQLIIRSAEKFSDTLGTFEYFIAFREIRAAGQIAGRPESLMRRAPHPPAAAAAAAAAELHRNNKQPQLIYNSCCCASASQANFQKYYLCMLHRYFNWLQIGLPSNFQLERNSFECFSPRG